MFADVDYSLLVDLRLPRNSCIDMPHVVAKLINDPKELLLNLFQNGLNARIIPYKKPGDELAIAFKKISK